LFKVETREIYVSAILVLFLSIPRRNR